MTAERTITTPDAITEEVLAYASTLGPGLPDFVEVAPADGALEDQPFYNTLMSGQPPVFGWLLWELTGFWLEAQRHAVIDRDGTLVDITPPIDAEARILFIRDPDWAFDYLNPTAPRRPQRHLLTDDPDVRAWAKLADEVDAFKWRNTRFKGDRSELSIAPGKDMRRMERLQRDYNAAAKLALGKPLT